MIHPIIMEDTQSIISQLANWEKLRGKTILITGASGLIASYMVYTLLYLNDSREMNMHILALVRNGKKASAQFGSLLERKDLTLIVQDVCSPLAYEGAVDYIVHAASQASPRYFTTDPVGTILANTTGTQNMLELARHKKNEGFLYISTREIYGAPLEGMTRITESDYGVMDPTSVRSCYPESKRMAETLCRAYAHQYDIQAKVARIAHTYGPDTVMDNGRVWGDFITNVVRGENIVLKSQGTMELAFTYIRDMVAGLFLVLLNGQDFVYNLANPNTVISVRGLAELLISLYPEKHLQVVMQIPKDTSAYLANKVAELDCTRAIGLGWNPNVSLEEGFRRTIAYQESKL